MLKGLHHCLRSAAAGSLLPIRLPQSNLVYLHVVFESSFCLVARGLHDEAR
jgi:hypothetical protein